MDNKEARNYIDKQCTFYEKPLIDNGTFGFKANSQILIPHFTSCYNDRNISENNPLNSIQMCTFHNFPAAIEHYIKWERELFNSYFIHNISELKNLIEKKEFFMKI